MKRIERLKALANLGDPGDKTLEELCEAYRKMGYDQGYQEGLKAGGEMSMSIVDSMFNKKKASAKTVVADAELKHIFNTIMMTIDEGHMNPAEASSLKEKIRETLMHWIADKNQNRGETMLPQRQARLKKLAIMKGECAKCGAEALLDENTELCAGCGDANEKGQHHTGEDRERDMYDESSAKRSMRIYAMEQASTKRQARLARLNTIG